MIGKITIGKSFKGCLLYCLNDKLQGKNKEEIIKDRAEVLLFNQCYGNQKELIQQFNEARQLNSKLSKPVLHITLSLAPGEQLCKDKLMELCQDCAKDMGFENNQYVAIHHKDTSHQHLHIVANRIGFDKRTVSDSNNFQKIAAYCRKMELKFNLTQVLSPRKFLPKDQRQIPRQDARKEQLKYNIQKTLQQANNYQQFEQKMKTLGYQVLKGRGISFIDDKKVKIKGSEVGFCLMKIEKILALKQQIESKESPKTIIQEGFLRGQNTCTWKQFSEPEKHLSKKYEIVPQTELKKQLAELINDLTKQENIPEQFIPGLLKKRRIKKRRRLNL
jgi:Relaxase/Mobilisation nuclease domain